MVERDIPVACETRVIPPCPKERASTAPQIRRVRSSKYISRAEYFASMTSSSSSEFISREKCEGLHRFSHSNQLNRLFMPESIDIVEAMGEEC